MDVSTGCTRIQVMIGLALSTGWVPLGYFTTFSMVELERVERSGSLRMTDMTDFHFGFGIQG